MNLPRKRVPSEVLKRGYSDDEVICMYDLGRMLLEHGELRRAEAIFQGLTEVAPDFAPPWLGLAFVQFHAGSIEVAQQSVKRALKAAPQSQEALLFLVTCLLSAGDYSSAGTYLGEIGEMIDEGELEDPAKIRFFKLQLARYQNRM